MSTHFAIEVRAKPAKDLELLRRTSDVLDANHLLLWNLDYNNMGLGIVIHATAEDGELDPERLREELCRLPGVTDATVGVIGLPQ